MDTAVLALVLQIPTLTLDRERLFRTSAECPILMGMPGHHLRAALQTRMQMEAKPPRGMHRHGHPIHMPMVGRRRLGTRIRGRRTPMSVEAQRGVERLPAEPFRWLLDGEVQLQGGLVDGVVAIIGAVILGYVDFSEDFIVLVIV